MKLVLNDPAMWARVAPYVDKAFDLEPEERAAWLASLTTTEPGIADTVRELLDEREHLNASNFLNRSPLKSARADSLTGKRVGAYTIERLLGRGGMGAVWLAARHDGRFDGQCAIKVLDALVAHPQLAERFHREGRLLARLVHPNIARLIDAGTTTDGRPYLALEYVNGEHIDRYCHARDIPVRERVRLFVDVVSAVAHAHSNLIVHRDLKPGNVFVTREGVVKLLDFGIAKLLTSESSEEVHTRFEDAALTPQYAAPEQLLGEPPSTATDVYQLGVLLYVLLTGQFPLQNSGSRSERIKALLEQVIPRASDCVAKPLRGALRGDLDAIVAVTLRKDPGERYATAAALRDDLVRYLESEPVSARRGATFYRTRKFVARYRWFVFGSVIAALTLCAVSLVAIDQARSAQRQALIASQEAAKATATTKFLEKVFAGPHIGKGSHRPPHELTAAELLDSGSAEMFNSLEQQPEIMLELIRVVGDIFMVMEDVDKSIALYRRGVEFAERRFGPVNSMKAELLVRVADAEAYAGRAAAANADVAIAEAAITAAGDEHSRHYARMLKVKGNLLLMKGSEFAAEAKEPLRRAAALFAEHFPNDVARAFALIYLAQAHLKLNEDVQAEQAAEQAVLATNNSNLDLIDQASAYSLRASIRHRLGKLGLAAGDYEIASTLYRRSVGTDHFMYVQNEGLRGELLQLSGHRSEGLALVEETTAQLASLRKGTPTYAIAARRLAQAYLRDGSYTRAIETNTEAIALVRPLHLPEPLALELLNQAEAFVALGRLNDAQHAANEAAELIPPKESVQNPAIAQVRYVFGLVALARGDLGAAAEFASLAHAATAENSNAERTRREQLYILESRLALERSDPQAALERIEHAKQLLAKEGSNANLFIRAEIVARHGVVLCRAWNRPEGRQMLIEGLSALRRIRSPTGYPLEELDRELARCRERISDG